MKKEQITAENFKNAYAVNKDYLNWNELCEDLSGSGDAMSKTENDMMEKYAQAKVEEELERDKEEIRFIINQIAIYNCDGSANEDGIKAVTLLQEMNTTKNK